MSDPPSRETPTEGLAETPEPDVYRWWLEYRGHRHELRTIPVVIGRSTTCQIVLDDALASRRHAEVVLEGGVAQLTDLESVNGVYVNGERVKQSRRLAPGDRVTVGQQEMIVYRVKRPSLTTAATQRFTAETLHGRESPFAAGRATLTDMDDLGENTGESFDLLSGLAEKVLALGRGDEAERLMSSPLLAIKKSAADHRLDAARAAKGVAWALKLATATGKGEWVDYLFDVYRMLGRPLPTETVDELYSVLRRVSQVNLAGLRAYVKTLQEARSELGPADRFLTQRIEGLERLAASR